jgi:DNA replication and repair protein RecF
MKLRHLSLTNFRNFIRLETDFPDGATLLIGDNAQGKTSLLESIQYLSTASSSRSSSDHELINFLALDEARVFSRLVGEIERGGRLQRIEIRLVVEHNNGERLHKEVLINGIKRRVFDLPGVLNTVLFMPHDLEIVERSPGTRRRYLDALISQAEPVYAQAISQYGKAVSQRNALLKQLEPGASARAQLEVWNEQVSEYGSILIRGRALALQEMQALAQPIHADLTRSRESLRLVYQPSFNPLRKPNGQLDLSLEAPIDHSTISMEQIQSGLRNELARGQDEDIQRGVTGTGPHRDELRFFVDSLDLHLFGSRGQSRTATLAVKLAEVQWLRERTGEWPVLLLDEIVAELDEARRQDLLQRVQQVHQSVLTASEPDMLTKTFFSKATLWRVQAGSLTTEGD